MKSSQRAIVSLNTVLKIELTAINQYFLHSRMFKNWGLEQLNQLSYKKSITDLKQADKLIDRILFLNGLPNLQDLGKIYLGEHTEEMLACDMKLQLEQLPIIKAAIACCEEEQDYVSRELLESILAAEEEHIDWIETQQYQISTAGIQNYLQAQIGDGE